MGKGRRYYVYSYYKRWVGLFGFSHRSTFTYRTFEEANIAIFRYIEGWYNRKRLHSSINYMTQNQCELLARCIA